MKYHWIITILRDGGGTYRTREGTIKSKPGETRQKLFLRVCDALNEPPVSYVVIFFSLERNDLS